MKGRNGVFLSTYQEMYAAMPYNCFQIRAKFPFYLWRSRFRKAKRLSHDHRVYGGPVYQPR